MNILLRFLSMSLSIQEIATGFSEVVPVPLRKHRSWVSGLLSWIHKERDQHWGTQLLRIASDMIIVCDESLVIHHHNRAFLKAVGYGSGSFEGKSLTDFFPESERSGVRNIFEKWRGGHAAGMRFRSLLLSRRSQLFCDLRVVRSRELNRSFLYYLIIREVGAEQQVQAKAETLGDPFFLGLPVAAWRMDAALRITHAYGSLWPELGVACEDLIGEVLGKRHDSLLPPILSDFDCSDVQIGMSSQSEIKHEGRKYTLSVEPALDQEGRVVGSIGFLRRSALPSATDVQSRVGFSSRGQLHHRPGLASTDISIVTTRVPTFER